MYATDTPTRPGPINPAPFQVSALRAMALTRTSRSTNCGKSAWRTGCSKAHVVEVMAPRTKICQTRIECVETSSAKTSAVSAETTWMKSIIFRRSIRSDMTPPRMKKLSSMTMRKELNRPR